MNDPQFWRRNPFLRILPALLTGILLQWYVFPQRPIACHLGATGAVLLLLTVRLPAYQRYRYPEWPYLPFFLLFAAAGAWSVQREDPRQWKDGLCQRYQENVTLQVQLTEDAVEKPGSYKAEARAVRGYRDNSSFRLRGGLLLYTEKDSNLLGVLRLGTELLIRKPLQQIQHTGNPGAFDQERYRLFRGTMHQVYLRAEDFIQLPDRSAASIPRIIAAVREWIIAVIRKHLPGTREQGLAEALLIGYRQDLDDTLVQTYARTGAIHIIAISGMHLALVYTLLAWSLNPLKRIRRLRAWIPPVVIAGLWGFSLLAGAQPSVLRSALMFTILAAGEMLDRRSSGINTLACSAFLLLLVQPFWLWDAGFQLSYTAVLGIQLFYKRIYDTLYIENKILDHCWKLMAVTLAAQVLTLPVSLFHFHQFPIYFFLSNLVAVPLSGLVLFGTIALCLLDGIPWVAGLTGKILQVSIRIMNDWVERVEQLPGAVWEGLQINLMQVILLFLCIGLLFAWGIRPKYRILVAALSILLLTGVIRACSFFYASRQGLLIVYRNTRSLGVEFIKGRSSCFFGHSGERPNDPRGPARILLRIRHSVLLEPEQPCTLLRFFGQRILIWTGPGKMGPEPDSIPIDLVIVAGKPGSSDPGWLRRTLVRRVALCADLPSSTTLRWKAACDALHIPVHDLKRSGALVMTLR
ncbi:MAG: hypothetical protein RJA57_1260 [Bacteroidota bacterium]|jgi:competence protein ComEC